MNFGKFFQANLERPTGDQPTDRCVGAVGASIIVPKCAHIGTQFAQTEAPKIQSGLVTFAVWPIIR